MTEAELTVEVEESPDQRYRRLYESMPLWWRTWQRGWWAWEVCLSKLTGRKPPMQRILDQANEDASREPGDIKWR